MKQIEEYKKQRLLKLHKKYPQKSYGDLAKLCKVSKSFAYKYIKNNK